MSLVQNSNTTSSTTIFFSHLYMCLYRTGNLYPYDTLELMNVVCVCLHVGARMCVIMS